MRRVVYLTVLLCALVFSTISAASCSAQAAVLPSQETSVQPLPDAAIPALLNAFDTHEIVALPAAHGEKDLDDLIFSLLRDPQLPTVVNDIVVECGNMRLQSVLDKFIAGEDISFAEVRRV